MIDAPDHLGRRLSSDDDWMTPDVDDLLALMDQVSVELIVNLDGALGRRAGRQPGPVRPGPPTRFRQRLTGSRSG